MSKELLLKSLALNKEMFEYFTKQSLDYARRIITLEQEINNEKSDLPFDKQQENKPEIAKAPSSPIPPNDPPKFETEVFDQKPNDFPF